MGTQFGTCVLRRRTSGYTISVPNATYTGQSFDVPCRRTRTSRFPRGPGTRNRNCAALLKLLLTSVASCILQASPDPLPRRESGIESGKTLLGPHRTMSRAVACGGCQMSLNMIEGSCQSATMVKPKAVVRAVSPAGELAGCMRIVCLFTSETCVVNCVV
jgi:hypothetical protein